MAGQYFKCKKCGYEGFSAYSKTCPQCGTKIKKDRLWVYFPASVALLIIIIVFVFTFSTGNNDTEKDTDYEYNNSDGSYSAKNYDTEDDYYTENYTYGEEDYYTDDYNYGVDNYYSKDYTYTEEEYKAMCNSYSYDEIARDPDLYIGETAHFTGEVIQVLEDGNYVDLRVNITQGYYLWEDTIYVTYERLGAESRILEGDIVELYGEMGDIITYESALGTNITLPHLNAKYIDIIY
mgnify:CR=1 FL=1